MIDRRILFRGKFLIKVLALIIILYYLSIKLNIFEYFSSLEVYINEIIITVILILGTLIFLDISLELIKRFFEKKGELRDYPIFASVFKYTTWFVAGLIGLSIIYNNIGSLLMSLGIIGAALTFALQRPIMNFAGWINIVITRPFKINDRIYIKDIGMGDVYKIDTMHIYLREVVGEPTGRNLIIPNAYVLTNSITNYTRGSPYIWDNVKVVVTYESNFEKAKKLVLEACEEVVGDLMKELAEIWRNKPRPFTNAKVYDKPILRVNFLDRGIELKVRYLVNTFEWADVKTEILSRILEKINKEKDVEIAYPHMEIIYRSKLKDRKWEDVFFENDNDKNFNNNKAKNKLNKNC
ncbi:MAG TPA: mechanosensitive ion channel family protein [Methanothermococcus okinawensis]|nr:mechanosensitive ion channel family protein [Methanothermococcus okinawensis]HIP34752.1 mechanosensitive ion channel family protein [Methanothermococcus okinawensis]